MARTSHIDYGSVGEDYLKHRQLQKGAAGWILLAGLGIAYVISGDFSGWNLGLAEGGWGGLLIASIMLEYGYGPLLAIAWRVVPVLLTPIFIVQLYRRPEPRSLAT